MKILQVSMLYDESLQSKEQLLESHYTITGWAEALQRKGAEVTVISRFADEAELVMNNVRYIFHKDDLGGLINARQIPRSFLKKVTQADADLVHLHNLSFSLSNSYLRWKLNKQTAMVLQHHGGQSPPKWKRYVHNMLNKVVDGFFFTTIEQGQDWLGRKSGEKIYPVMEGATFFNYAERDRSRTFIFKPRKERIITGDPVFLWVGRLDENKDPLTVLDGFEQFFNDNLAAKLYMIYNDGWLLDKVKAVINESPVLQDRVQLLEKVPHSAMQSYYESADYFVLGSHHEGSGYALGEALSCGCIPIVTNIPSFRMMTNKGSLGANWEPSDKGSFVRALLAATVKNKAEEGQACMNFFRDHLSFDSIAEKAMVHYQSIVARRK